MRKFIDANEAFECYYNMINNAGIKFNNTKALFNIGFKIKLIKKTINLFLNF